jgi:TolB-like protein
VVLPFANMGSDPEQDYFVDGVTESLTTGLSRIGGFFVIGRNTAFTYKGKPVDLKQIGRELADERNRPPTPPHENSGSGGPQPPCEAGN